MTCWRGQKKKRFWHVVWSPPFPSTTGISYTERSARHLSLSGEGRDLRVAQSVVQRGFLSWWEMTSSTGLWLWSPQIRVKYSSYWLVRLHPAFSLSLSGPPVSCHGPLDENTSLFSFPSFVLSLFICSQASPLLNKLQGHWWQRGGGAGVRKSALISSQSAMQNFSIVADLKIKTTQ